ncbi:MAG TPA: hypothetical protein VJV79_21185 [Polyangiaceae bacterium]|nr:hypothetical protein [Polyangiaceae bacterium]
MTFPRLLPQSRPAALGLALGAAIFGCSDSENAASGGLGGEPIDRNTSATAGLAGHTNSAAGSALSGGVGGTAGGTPASAGASAQGGLGTNAGAPQQGGAPANVGGTSGGTSGGSVKPEVTGIIAVGYGGLRVVSRDLGRTWQNETHWSSDGGDDEDLLRTIAYGNGLWLSAGWRLVTSTDGVAWTDRGMAEQVITPIRCPVTDGLAFGAGKFLVACGSNLASSSDGLSWTRVARTPDVGGHPYLIWHEAEQQFACAGDDGPSFVSDDGASWTEVAISKVHLCDGALEPKTECQSFSVQGVFLTSEWGGVIRRSSTGKNFEKTYQDQFENNLFTEYSFGVGRVAP